MIQIVIRYKWFFALLIIGLLAWFVLGRFGGVLESNLKLGAKSKPKPNVILIMTDDQGYGDFSLHGCDSCFTPNLDDFAQNGVQFERFYVSPVCAPTRASLLTGRYHLRTGTTWVTHRKEVMNSDEMTIAEVFKAAGYKTGIFGKWHNGEQFPNTPKGQGFDDFFGFAAGHWNNYFDTKLEYNGEKVETKGYITDVLTDKAIDFIQGNKNEPFFCYIPYNAPHGPFQVPDKYFDKYKRMGLSDKNACIYAMNENIDDNFGRIMAMLKEQELEDNTIVVFLTDNGPNGRRFNGSMKGWKAKVDEGGVRVPLFVQWKNHLPKGKIIKELASHIDLMPTLMELCNIKNEEHKPFDGRSLVSLLKKEDNNWQERNIYSIQNDGTPNDYPASVRNNRYRLVKDNGQNILLYDMIADPAQTTNIANRYPKITQQLKSDLENWFKEVTQNGIEPPLAEVGHSASPLVYLPAPEAQLVGNVVFEGGRGWANDWIKNWQGHNEAAIWEIKVVESGTYQFAVEYTSDMAGVQLIIEAPDLISSTIETIHDPDFLPSPDRVTRGEVYEKEWKRLTVGEVHYEKGNHKVVLSCAKIPKNINLNIKAIVIEKK